MPKKREGLNIRRFSLAIICLSFVIFIFASDTKYIIFAQGDNEETDVINVKRDGRQIQARIPKEVPDPDSGRPSAAGSILVRFRPSVSVAQQDQVHRNAGALKVDRLYLGNTRRVHVPQASLAAVLAAYRANPAVEYAVPDRIVRALVTPNDPNFNQQWGMAKVNAPSAWDLSTSLAATRVAILDCGVYDSTSTFISPDGKPGHPDVRDKVVARINFTTSRDTDDWCDHGTHVSGIAAAVTNNGIGVSGLGYSDSVVNVKVLGDNGSGTFSWVINGILWAAGCDTNPCGPRRAEIINMSLGATGSCDPLVQTAIDKAWVQGMVIVAAAGNSSASGAITPANCNNVIGVAASDSNDTKASFSNFGSGVDVAAPGVNILSTDYIGNYASFSGTSMASPHVAGEAALIWTTSYNTSNQAVVDRIFSTANKSALAGSNFGRIDAFAAVGGSGIPFPSPSPSPTPSSSPFPSPSPVPISCIAPVIISHTDTNPTRGGTVSFAWSSVDGAVSYRVQRQRSDGTWNTRATISATSFTGSDASNDPNWRVFVSAGTCTPIPGPATVFNP